MGLYETTPSEHELRTSGRAAERLSALASFGVLDTPPEPALDDIVCLAAQLCATPIARITFVDDHRQFFKARLGCAASEAPLDHGFCPLVVDSGAPLIIADTAADPRHAARAANGSRFYAGAPLSTADGLVLGALCVQDWVPRTLGHAAAEALVMLARQVMTQLTLRASLRRERESAEQLGLILASAVDYAIIATDRDGRVTGWNAGAERILGWAADDMQGMPVECIFTPEDQAEARAAGERAEALRTDRVSDERWHQRRDGSRFWASGEMMPLRDPDGAHLGYLKMLRDRTPERQARAETAALLRDLQAERLRLRTLLDHAPIGILFAEAPSGRVTVQNRRAGQIIGDVLAESIEQHGQWLLLEPDGDVLPPERHPLVRALTQGDSTAGEEYLYRRPGAPPLWVQLTATPIHNALGAITGGVLAIEDIDARKQAELALRGLNETLEQQVEARTVAARLAEARFRGIFDSSYQLSGLIGLDGTVLESNRAALDAIGAAAAEVAGRLMWETPWFERAPDAANALRRAFPVAVAGEFVRREITLVLRDSQARTYDFSLSPVRDDGGHIVCLVAEARDITHLRATEAHLRQSQKMEAVGQLTGGLAHDFNNLLTGISGSLELLQLRMAQGRPGEVARYIDAAQGAAARAAALTHRLLAFSRRQTLAPRPIEANRLIADMQQLIQHTVGPSITLQVVPAGGLWPTLCDPNQLENALLNLAINARDAMPDGGRLTIETDNLGIDKRQARRHDLAAGEYVVICVNDTGTGMSPEVAARAFDPFFTTKPLGQGTGLGLSMIYGFARQSGGEVRIHTAPGRGTSMRIYLPRHHGEPPPTPSPAPSGGLRRAGTGERILVVDDDATIRMLVAELLGSLGYVVFTASDGAGGLAMLRSTDGIDLLVSDVGLPGGMNGRQMADAAREQRPGLKVLFITGYAEAAVIDGARLDPGMHVMTKPFRLEMLADRVRAVLEQA